MINIINFIIGYAICIFFFCFVVKIWKLEWINDIYVLNETIHKKIKLHFDSLRLKSLKLLSLVIIYLIMGGFFKIPLPFEIIFIIINIWISLWLFFNFISLKKFKSDLWNKIESEKEDK